MTQFNKEDLLVIAKLSALELNDEEINLFTKQIGGILSYVNKLQEVDTSVNADPVRNQNIFREDIVQPCNADAVLAQAPEREGRYIVVPNILD